MFGDYGTTEGAASNPENQLQNRGRIRIKNRFEGQEPPVAVASGQLRKAAPAVNIES